MHSKKTDNTRIFNTQLVGEQHGNIIFAVDKMICKCMNEDIEKAKGYIKSGDIDLAVEFLSDLLQKFEDKKHKADVFYLLGNIYRKKSDWKLALDNYQSSMDLNPEGPAKGAHKMILDIMNFFHKDMYNH